MLGFDVLPVANLIWRLDLAFKKHGIEPRAAVYHGRKATNHTKSNKTIVILMTCFCLNVSVQKLLGAHIYVICLTNSK